MSDTRLPLDDATLIMLRSACEINPDNEQTNLHAFLDMGTREKSRTLIREADEDYDGGFDGAPIYEVEYEEGYEPFSEHEVIIALVDEVFRLREALGA